MDRAAGLLAGLVAVLAERAEAEAATVMPGFTHLQAAQPVTFGHHLLAYGEMFMRDVSRFRDARQRLNECPLGAAALAGTSFPIDRAETAAALGFARPAANSIDAVSDRDFALDYLASAAIAAIHLSRLAEELVLWSTPQFGFVKMAEAFTSGSSIMPQKRNPDAAELVRGKSGRVIGHLQALLVTLKGLPLAYSKDMQEDKEGVFDAVDTLELCLEASAAMLATLTVDPARMRAAAGIGYTTATDLADWLVRVKGAAFRDAHGSAARAVKAAEERGCGLHEPMPRRCVRSTRGPSRRRCRCRRLGSEPDEFRRTAPARGARGGQALRARLAEPTDEAAGAARARGGRPARRLRAARPAAPAGCPAAGGAARGELDPEHSRAGADRRRGNRVKAFTYRDGGLACEAVPLEEIARAVGTPAYVYSAGAMRARLREFQAAFADRPALFCFASRPTIISR